MLEDKNRGFARNARDLTKDELVSHKITEHGDGRVWKSFNNFYEALGFVRLLVHGRNQDFLMRRAFAPLSDAAWYLQR